jgi:hypothetical protein
MVGKKGSEVARKIECAVEHEMLTIDIEIA